MPHFKIWHFPPELTDGQRQRLAAALETVAVDVFGTSPNAVSVDEIAVPEDAWKVDVFDVEIGPRHEGLVRKPGYSM
ncbi:MULTISPECIES: tautomerase PptA [Curtobacterium]|uniref:tautomerase PptA n=1 Tax=Curtobacterium TaxID=2034 RepID=UPI0011A518FA|nr:tautomerase PptA [Curtobacterium pusillum]